MSSETSVHRLGNQTSRTSLLLTLQRAHFRVASFTLLAVGFSLTVSALMALRTLSHHNLQLVARSIAITAEAAVVFRDPQAVQESLDSIAKQESLSSAQVVDVNGRVLGSYQRPSSTLLDTVGDRIVSWMLVHPTSEPIVYQGSRIGDVHLHGDGAGFIGFIVTGLFGMLLCLSLSAIALRKMLRSVQDDILLPVQDLAATTHMARFDRSTAMRVPASNIAEFHQLGEDFNALLSEIEAHQAQLRQENRSLSHLADHDSLTGLPNRACFRRRLTRALQDAASQNSGLAVLYLDNDHFKSVNDRYGHAVGDALLIEVAERAQAQVRETDVVARLGGDEFAILLSPLVNAEDAARIARKIVTSMAAPLPLEQKDRIVPSVSIGIAIYPAHGKTAEQLLSAADEAMYRAKNQQRGSHLVFSLGAHGIAN